VSTNVLLVEDNPADAVLVSELLREHSPGEFALSVCTSLHDAHAHLAAESSDCVLLDLSLPDAHGLDGVEDMQDRHRALPLVVLTGNSDDGLALRAVYRGAQDYLVKNAADATQIARAIRYAVERKRAEREIEEAKDRFFAAVSHDLRTPLACIIGYLEEVMEESAGLLNPEMTSFLEVAAVNAERLRRLVNDVLFMARARAGGPDLDCAQVDVADVAQTAAAAVRPFAAEKGIALRVEGEPVPPVWADASRLQQVLDNLLSNAIKYTPSGGEVTLRVGQVDDEVAVAVSDTGVGIGAEDRDHVFEFFYRAAAVREAAVSGVGLGLSIVKTIVDAHGGTVRVESTPGAGSCFTVVLPVVFPVQGATESGGVE
jgi:signal transduction histidine kinase